MAVVVENAVEIIGTQWSGGSRSNYFMMGFTGGIRPTSGNRQTDDPRETPIAPTGNGIAIVEGGTFCGKPSTLRVSVHPDDLSLFGIE